MEEKNAVVTILEMEPKALRVRSLRKEFYILE